LPVVGKSTSSPFGRITIATPSSPLIMSTWYGMVWYGAPPTPCQCVLSLRVVASCFLDRSVTRVSEQHRQAMQSALVQRWVRPCDAGNGKRME
jgi:hypothetical protein